MKFFLISDNTDTQMGMRLAGIEGIVVSRPEEVTDALEKANIIAGSIPLKNFTGLIPPSVRTVRE